MDFFKPVPGRSHRTKDITGLTYGNLIVIRYLPNDGSGAVKWACKCKCGKEVVLICAELRGGQAACSRNCPLIGGNPGTHRMSGHPAYWVWRAMLDRCRLPTCPAWKNYGGRGITVCTKWQKCFQNFWEDMGSNYQRGLTLERKDNAKGYDRENCCWATRKEQSRNTRKSIKLKTPWGKVSLPDLAEYSGVKRTTIYSRYKKGLRGESLWEKIL